MEEQNIHEEAAAEQKQEAYYPRPAWQVWGARIGVVIMIIAFALYCWRIAMGGI